MNLKDKLNNKVLNIVNSKYGHYDKSIGTERQWTWP